MMTLQIGDRTVGDGQPCFIIAEAGVNHNGDMALAMRLIDIASSAGADAIKFQKRRPCVIYTKQELEGPPDWAHDFGETLGEYWETIELEDDEHKHLKAYAQAAGLIYLCSSFDAFSLQFTVEDLKVPAIKVPSSMFHSGTFLAACKASELPVIASTGFCTEEMVLQQVEHLALGNTILLQCTGTYPCSYEEVDLRAIQWLRGIAGLTGYSGHEQGIHMGPVAVTLGACVIERHITADRSLPGCDHAASLEPDGLYRLVRDIRDVEKALKHYGKRLHPSEEVAAKRLKLHKHQTGE